MDIRNFDELFHYGTPRHSGRYPWGSGEDPYQHEEGLLGQIKRYEAEGKSEKDIATQLGMSTTTLRKEKSLALARERAELYSRAYKMRFEKQMSYQAIADELGFNSESSIRSLLDPVIKERAETTKNTVDALKKCVEQSGYIDVGEGTQNLLGVSKQKLKTALHDLANEGYVVTEIEVEQMGMPGKYTKVQVLAPEGTTKKDIWEKRDKIEPVFGAHSNDNGKTFLGLESPKSLSSSRLQINYAEDGGVDKDGVIELRRGVKDISLGGANYAQVRIAVDGTHYLKGMAVYADDLPDGIDIRFNTNKKRGTPALGPKDNSVLKPLKSDPDNPFGSMLKSEDGVIVGQKHYIDDDGKDQLGVVNIVREEGDWNSWSKTLASQMLSKQYPATAKKQLDISFREKKEEFDEINSLANPEVKRDQLIQFADNCDAASVHLKAAALPRQSTKVILPLTDIRKDEIYAPTYNDGEQVILIRYPHGGTFEIPVLTVNNHSKQGKASIGKQPIDAVGISKASADILSGADFDGDTVLVIPTKGQNLKGGHKLKDLENFSTDQYKIDRSDPIQAKIPTIKSKTKQTEMGKVTNLITDMTIKGAPEDEIARAVKHSMVVIDAEKHDLNYKQSFIDNDIASLKKAYQGGENKGASTLISKASSTVWINQRKLESIDINTGEKIFKDTNKVSNRPIKDKNGNITGWKQSLKQEKVAQMSLAKDARELSSGTLIENYYADYANKLKAMANDARKEAMNTSKTKLDPEAKKRYSPEVASLNAKLNLALKNKPYERQAQLLASKIFSSKRADNPDMDAEEIKKIKTLALNEARNRVGASKKDVTIDISDREWEAIQSGAISSTKLVSILQNANKDRVKQLAMPKETQTISPNQINRIHSMANNGYSQAEIADALGISTSTVSKHL